MFCQAPNSRRHGPSMGTPPPIRRSLDDAKRSSLPRSSRPCTVQPNAHYPSYWWDQIIKETRGYPYFRQEWGKHSWDVATSSPITLADVNQATTSAIAALDESFFRVRFDRLTPLEKRYLRAMSDIGAGPHRSGDIAEKLGRGVTSLGPTRSQLIVKGMIWSASHGDTAFTVPLFDAFMKRIMPGDEWRQ